jgi:hypothetical protein
MSYRPYICCSCFSWHNTREEGRIELRVKRYDKTQTYSYDGSGKYATYTSCSAKCKADSKCVSFAFGGSECNLYKLSVASNVTPNSGSKYTFYDTTCVTSSSTTTSSSQKTTSSTMTTPTSSVTSSSSSTSSTSPVASPSCGVKGYDKINTYNFDGKAADANFAVYSARCKADSKCASFTFGNGQCLLYKANV